MKDMRTELPAPQRRKTDGAPRERVPRRAALERAYQIYVLAGCDPSRLDECWQEAERELLREITSPTQ